MVSNMTYTITERYDDGTGTTVGVNYQTMEDAIKDAKDFYRYEERRIKYEVAEGFDKVVWTTDEILPWDDV